MTGRCRLAVVAMIVLGAVCVGSAAHAAEVTSWFVDADSALNVEVKDGGYVVKSERILLTSDVAVGYFYSVKLPSGTRFTLPGGWTVNVASSAAQGIGSVGTLLAGGEEIEFTEGDTVLFSSLHGGDIPLTARFAALTAPAASVPFIQRHPQHRSVWVGETAIFDVEATGEPPLFYQWQRYGGGGWRNISGEQERTLRVRWAQISDSGARYRVIVGNRSGSVASAPAYLSVSYAGYDDPYDLDSWPGYGVGCDAGTLAPLALLGLYRVFRRRSGG